MATTTKRLTYDELDGILQERAGDRHELIDGELVVTPSPIPVHQIISANLFRSVDRYVVDHDLGRVLFAPVDIRLTPDNVLIPDIVFISQARLHIIGPRTVDAPPDLAIEILSPGTRRRDLEVKRALYARFGVQEYWIVDPVARSVTVLALQGTGYELIEMGKDGALPSRVLPALELTIAQVFAGV